MRRKKNDAVAPAPKNLIINWGDKIAVAKGGLGGVVPARPVTRSSHALSLSVLSHPSSRGEKSRFRFPRLPHHPPCPPFAQRFFRVGLFDIIGSENRVQTH